MNIDIKFYFFIDTLDEIIRKNIKNFKKLSFIYKSNSINDINHANIKTIKNFCKKNKIPFFISDNFKLAKKYEADGIFLSSSYKKIGNIILKKNFKIIGSAHNQLEYFIKKRQSCKTIMLSPIFYNKKYSVNKILNPIKFNLMSLDWKIDLCALGGLSKENIGKIKMTKAQTVGIKSLVNKR